MPPRKHTSRQQLRHACLNFPLEKNRHIDCHRKSPRAHQITGQSMALRRRKCIFLSFRMGGSPVLFCISSVLTYCILLYDARDKVRHAARAAPTSARSVADLREKTQRAAPDGCCSPLVAATPASPGSPLSGPTIVSKTGSPTPNRRKVHTRPCPCFPSQTLWCHH